LLPGKSALDQVSSGLNCAKHTFFFHFQFLLYLVSLSFNEAQDMENNIINVGVVGRLFSQKKRFLCKFKFSKYQLINTPNQGAQRGLKQTNLQKRLTPLFIRS